MTDHDDDGVMPRQPVKPCEVPPLHCVHGHAEDHAGQGRHRHQAHGRAAVTWQGQAGLRVRPRSVHKAYISWFLIMK